MELVDNSYDVPASTPIDPYSGEPLNNPSQHIENKTLQISIKNKPIQIATHLYYKIRMKGHFSTNWSNISYIRATPDSEYTVLTYALGGNNASGNFDSWLEEISSGDKVDFQVQAQLWHYELSVSPNSQFGGGWIYVMKSASSWSSTQTMTIGARQTSSPQPTTPTSPTPMPFEEPQIDQKIILGVIAIVAVFAFGLVLLYRIKKKISSNIVHPFLMCLLY